MNVYGELIRGQLENLAADPSSSARTAGRVFWNTAEGRAKHDNGSAIRSFLANDQACVFGTNGTAATNVRWNRSGVATLELLTGDATTAEGTSDSTKWAKLNTKLGGSLVDTYVDYTPLSVSPSTPVTNARMYAKNDGRFYYNDGVTEKPFVTASTVGTLGQRLKAMGSPTVPTWLFNTVSTATTTYAVLLTDDLVLLDATAGTFTATLPNATTCVGKQFTLKKTDSSFTVLTIATSGGTINGASTTTVATQNETLTVISNGTNYDVIARGGYSSEWTTSSIGGSWTSPGATFTGFQRREGDSLHLRVLISIASLTGVSGNLTITLPNALTMDTAKITSTASGTSPLGEVVYYDASGGSTGRTWGSANYSTSTTISATVLFSGTSSYQIQITDTAPVTPASGDKIFVDAIVPITNWK